MFVYKHMHEHTQAHAACDLHIRGYTPPTHKRYISITQFIFYRKQNLGVKT